MSIAYFYIVLTIFPKYVTCNESFFVFADLANMILARSILYITLNTQFGKCHFAYLVKYAFLQRSKCVKRLQSSCLYFFILRCDAKRVESAFLFASFFSCKHLALRKIIICMLLLHVK